jgi:hypothetical protein
MGSFDGIRIAFGKARMGGKLLITCGLPDEDAW